MTARTGAALLDINRPACHDTSEALSDSNSSMSAIFLT